jgi:hypothetical protein
MLHDTQPLTLRVLTALTAIFVVWTDASSRDDTLIDARE